jgi:hypothetical protein
LPFVNYLKNKISSLNSNNTGNNFNLLYFLLNFIMAIFHNVENEVTTVFDKSIRDLFDGIDMNQTSETIFTSRIRSLLVDNILDNIELNPIKRHNIYNELKKKYKKKINEEDEKDENEEYEKELENAQEGETIGSIF